jgi:DNA-binding NtrC family response regulator
MLRRLMERRVLVVEDDAATRSMISAVLAREALKVDMCVDDRDAKERLELADYRVVVLALVRADPSVHRDILRTVARKAEPPCVILISAGSQLDLDAEMSDVIRARLRKPFSIDHLVQVVKDCFEPPLQT